MDLNRFTEKSQDALHNAQALAIRRHHQGLDIEHLLAALIDQQRRLDPCSAGRRRHCAQRGQGRPGTGAAEDSPRCPGRVQTATPCI